MAAPTANFRIEVIFGSLQVKFTDSSSETPTAWSWSFGASSSPATSTTAGPHTVTFPSAGQYTVTLQVTNTDGTSTISRTINVSDQPVLPLSITDMVKAKLLGVNVDPEIVDNYIAQWQLYLAPLVDPEIASGNTFNEFAWPALANALIAYLAAYSCINDWGRAIMLGSSQSTTETGSTTVQSQGALKTLETGPSKAEWHDNTERISNFFKTGSSASGTGYSPLDQLTREICALASRLNIGLPMCPPLPKPVMPIRVIGKRNPLIVISQLNYENIPIVF